MSETILKRTEADYQASLTKVLKGDLILTRERLMYAGEQQRMQFDHGVIGNAIQDKMKAMAGHDQATVEHVFNLPVADVSARLKRYGFSKRLVITDAEGTEYRLFIWDKKERNAWVQAIQDAREGGGTP